MIKLHKYKLYPFSKEKASGFIEKIYEIPTTCCVLYRNQAETFLTKQQRKIAVHRDLPDAYASEPTWATK